MYEGFRLLRLDNNDKPRGFQVSHSTTFVLVDALGDVRGLYDSLDDVSLQKLRKDALALMKERV